MEKPLKKTLKKMPKIKITKFNAMIAVMISISLALLVYALVKYISYPNTYEELLPMMDEAQEFDRRAAELAGVYDSIEDQIGEDVYFDIVEEGYEDAVITQQKMIDDIKQENEEVAARGGITTFEDLQALRQPATDKYKEQEINDYFEGRGYKVPSKEAEGAIAASE